MRDEDSEILAGCQLAIALVLCLSPLPWAEWLVSDAAPAWVQSVGSVAAILAAIFIDRGSARREREARRATEAIALSACSRLVTVFRIKAEATLGLLQEGRHANGRVGQPVRDGFEAIASAIRAFPIVSIPNPYAVVLFCDAIQRVGDVTLLLRQFDEKGTKYGAERGRESAAWAVEHLTPLVAILIRTDDELRKVAGI